MKKIILIVLSIFTLLQAYGQSRTVQGRVFDENGDPLIGATVVVRSASGASQNGTTTDVEGNFSLEVSEGSSTLTVSYIGYENQLVDISGLTMVEVNLQLSAEQLEEVVVTALGIKKDKKALGYAFSDVDGESLTTNRDINFINSISNKVAGVNISQTAGGAGTSSRIIIRGIKSLSTESQPLIVVDGVPMENSSDGASWLGGVDYGNSLMGISPDDIESMSVLKGPNAAALYGSRAAMGVILITTKQGTKQDRMTVTVNSNFMFDRAYIVAKYQNEYGAGYGGGMQYQALSEDLADKLGADSAYFNHSYRSWGPQLVDTLRILNWNYEWDTLSAHPDNVKDYFRNGWTFTNSVAIDKGNEQMNWRLSASDLENKGLKPNSTYSRRTVNFNMNSKLNDKFSVGFKANYIREDAFNRVGQGNSQTGSRNFVWMPRSIDIHTLEQNYMGPNGYEQNWYNGGDPDWHTNPYWEAYENYNNDHKDQFNGFIKIDAQLTPWLKAFMRTSMDTYTTKRYLRIASKARRANGEGSYTEKWINYRSLNHDFLLSADKEIADGLNLMVNAGGNYYGYFVDYQSSTITGLKVPNFFSLNNPLHPDLTSVGTSQSRKVIQSFYGSAQFSYKNWLYTEITARNDWSSSLPEGNNSYFYPSINSSLVFSELLDMDKRILSFGKIRGSWAQVGNDTSPYRLGTYFYSQDYGEIPLTYLSDFRGNPNLKPERTNSWEVGADLRFFMSRVNLDITYYNEVTFDQIVTAELSKPSGFSNMIVNGGEIENKGVELQLNLVPVETGDFRWDIDINFAKNKNTVLSLVEDLTQFTITGESQMDVLARPGRPYGEIVGTRITRYYETDTDGNIVDNPNNGRPLIDDQGFYVMEERGVIGNITPDWTGGLSSALRWKDLTLSFSIGVQKGGDMFSKTNKYGLDNGQFEETLEGRESWYAASQEDRDAGLAGYVAEGVLADGSENMKGIDPQVYFHQRKWGGIAELDVYDASYVKLRDLTINYNFPSAWFGDSFLKSASLAFVGKNLWLIYSSLPNVDPESAFSSNNNALGQEYASMPVTRSVGFNLKLVF